MTPEERIYAAIILNEPYAQWVKDKKKLIETRMKMFNFSGDIVICCDKGKSKHSPNAGNAICLVHMAKGRPMTDDDEKEACIENVKGRIAYPLTNHRYFSYDFRFTDYHVDGSYQQIFRIRIPDFVTIIGEQKVISNT